MQLLNIQSILIWLISAGAIACILTRPRGFAEVWYAVAGAVLLVVTGLESVRDAWGAVGKGLDVYLFLSGMMLLSEIARREGVFDWCAGHASRHARGSLVRLFWLMYGVEVLVTVFLSNDATAVVMTPAVLVAARAAKVENPLPFLFSCALVANAASFVLPISNPANIVLFDGDLPQLMDWLQRFLIPSLVSVGLTAVLLYGVMRSQLKGAVVAPEEPMALSASGKLALGGIAFAAVALITASALHYDLGAPTLLVALVALGLVSVRDKTSLREAPRHVAWSVLPLVAGLFVIVEAVNHAGALELGRAAMTSLEQMSRWWRDLIAAFGITALSNVINNLPSGLITGALVTQFHPSNGLRNALLIGVDLGPNISVTGSLATLLWLIALRRDGQKISAWAFLKVGLIVTPLTLVATVLVSTLLTHR